MGTIIQKGIKYGSGNDGFSPVITVTDIENGHKVDIKDVNGTKTFEVLNGKDSAKVYSSLADLGLDTTATLKDITRNMAKNSMIAIKVDAMADQSEYNNITQGTVTIHKVEDARVQAIMTNKADGITWVGTLGGENTIIGWKELRSDSPFYRAVVQGVAGYFKFKPTSNGIDQSLRISVTDNYGGMINISGATPSSAQYKPFKCIRLSNGTYTNYDAIKTTNNKMEKLYYYDGYFYLKVVSYTTCTFTGLIEAPSYVETFDETVAEEIPIRSVFDTPYNNGYADPSIICIGDADTSDGVIKTLATLGFTGDVMTWDNGEYRVSHVGGLTNLPAEITEEKPGFRLEHHDVKKWGNNHNPHHSTYGCRQSILHYKGNIFVRYQESGATAGVITADTGWRCVSVLTTELTELGLDGSATIQDVMDKMSIGQHCIINTSRFDDKTQVGNIEYGKVEIRRLSSGMWSLWLEDVLHGDVVAHGTCSASKFVGWHYLATKKVADVGFTTINQTNGLTVPTGITMTDSSKVNYCIRNGICYVHIALQISSISAKVNSWTTIAELPKSVIETVGAMNCEGNTIADCMPIRVSQAGKLTLMYKGTTTSTSDWWGYSFSYPVAE